MSDRMELNRTLAWVSRMKVPLTKIGLQKMGRGLKREWRNEGKRCGQNYKFNSVAICEKNFLKMLEMKIRFKWAGKQRFENYLNYSSNCKPESR